MVIATRKRTRRSAGPYGFKSPQPTVIESALDELASRARQLLGREIDFIDSDEFRRPNANRRILDEQAIRGEASDEKSGGKLPKDLPGHLARLCEARLLSAQEERNLFQRMNYLKYRANVCRARLNPDEPDAESLDEIERLLEHAARIRDRIIKSNMRLVIAIVKKFVTPKHSFDELLSDGIVSLMQAVDKFDCGRGFRFSTYAYRAIARKCYRTVSDQHKENSRFDAAVSEDLTSLPERDRCSALDEYEQQRMRTELDNLMHRLDRREQFILRGRFALGPHRAVRTFQCLADRLGVSKERVRQLERRAVAKLQAMARQIDPAA